MIFSSFVIFANKFQHPNCNTNIEKNYCALLFNQLLYLPSRWKPSCEERRLLNPLEPPGDTGLWTEKPPPADLVGEGDLAS